MAHAVAHVLLAIIFIELFREYILKDKKKLPRYYILIAALGGVLPDLDILLYYILYFFGFSFEQIHRTFLHTLFIPLIFLIIGILFYRIDKNYEIKKWKINLAKASFILSAGSFIHLIIDLLSGGIMPFYPISQVSIGINISNFLPESLRPLFYPFLDGILLIFWLLWMEFKLKVNNYF